jgi:serine/threonine protein kinase
VLRIDHEAIEVRQVLNQGQGCTEFRHPNIIRLYGWFHDSTRIFMMMEYAGQGEVFKHLAKAGKFSEKRSSRVSWLFVQVGVRLTGSISAKSPLD